MDVASKPSRKDMKLQDYISEAISSGRNRSKYFRSDTFSGILRMLVNNGAKIVNDFSLSTTEYKDKIVVTGEYSTGYKAPIIKLSIPLGTQHYYFEIIFDDDSDRFGAENAQITHIFAYKGLYSIMTKNTTDEKLDFIKKSMGIKWT